MNFGSEGDKGNQTPSSGIKSDSMVEGEASIRSPTPASNDDFPTVKKRKSGTFWRRRSSMGLDTAFGPNGGSGVGTIDTTNGAMNGNRHGDHNDLNRDHKEVAITEQENEKQLPQIPLSPVTNYEEEMLPQRSYSPPPQLPDFIGAGGGLGGEDLFKDIH